MKRETQTVEFKQSWHDEYLEWICGYANAFGGTLYIGRADDGKPVGVAKAKALMESIPCKITDTMGIVADVNLMEEHGKDVIEIVVEKCPSLISYHGKYFYRSGSTMRTITGKELDKLILRQHGRTWDAVPLPKIKASQLDAAAFAYFKDEAVRRKRLSWHEVNVSREVLLENLRLVDDEGYLMRAAMMAFHHDPEKWITGAYVKIGYFGRSDSDLQYQDEVHGPLLTQADRVVDLVYTKYLKALITYEGIHRVEQYMFHKDAFREIVLNAIVHKDYASCNPIQISVYPDKIYIWNDGTFPDDLNTATKLYRKHSSKPYNPKLANVFFKCGLIEAWGRGFEKIIEGCREYAGPRPTYKISASGVMVLCKACPAYEKLQSEQTGKKSDGDAGLKTGLEIPEIPQDGALKTLLKSTQEGGLETGMKAGMKTSMKTGMKTADMILVLLRENSELSIDGLAAELNRARSSIIEQVAKLKQAGKLRRVGPDKGGHWEVLAPPT